MSNRNGNSRDRRATYDRSVIERDRLRAFAVRVARETRAPRAEGLWYVDSRTGTQVMDLEPHWLLDERRSAP